MIILFCQDLIATVTRDKTHPPKQVMFVEKSIAVSVKFV